MIVPPTAAELVERFERRLDLYKRAETSTLVEAAIQVHEKDVIPKESKTLLKSGKLSVKPMPKTKYDELYQDCVSVWCEVTEEWVNQQDRQRVFLTTLPR